MSKDQNKNTQDIDEWWENEQQKGRSTGKWYDKKLLVIFFFQWVYTVCGNQTLFLKGQE